MRIQWGGLPGLKGIGRGEGWEVEEVRDGYQAGVDLIKLLWKAKKEKKRQLYKRFATASAS